MLQVLPFLQKQVNLRVMGKQHLPDPSIAMSFWEVASLCKTPLKNGKPRIFHARRVDEMIQALVLKYIFGAKIKIVFSSAAQRHRSAFTVWLTSKMDAVLAMCKASASYLSREPNAIIYHGVRSDKYQPAQDKSKAWQELGYPGKYGIGILGRVRKQKGVHLFVEACIEVLEKHTDFTAVIVGAHKGNEKFVTELKDKVAKANLSERIIFTGEQPFDKLPQIFSSLSLVAALSNNEGFGLTVLEAMSSGAAVLATEAGAWKEVIREGVDGHVVPVDSLEQIKEKLNHMLSSPEKLAQMGINGRERVLDKFTVEREAKELGEFLLSLMVSP